MVKNEVARQALEREYYLLLDRMCDCHAALTSIVRNASYSESIKDATDPLIRDLYGPIAAMYRTTQEIIALQMKTKVTVEP